MTWPTRTSADWLSGATVTEGGEALWDLVHALFGRSTSVVWNGTLSTSSATFATLRAFDWRVPPFARSGDIIQFSVYLVHDTAATVASFRIQDNAAGTNGTTVTVTGTTEDLVTSELTIPDNTWAGTTRTFNLQANRGASGNASFHVEKLGGNLRLKAA